MPLTLMRSFSLCHFSTSSSISMILSCSCSFCSDSSVCREGVRLEEKSGGGGRREPENRRANLGRAHHSSLHSANTYQTSDNLGTTPVTKDPATSHTHLTVNSGLLGLDIPGVSL